MEGLPLLSSVNESKHNAWTNNSLWFTYPFEGALLMGAYSMIMNIPGRQAGCSTWSHDGGCGFGERSRCSGAPPWTNLGALETRGPGEAGGWRRGSRWNTEIIRVH